MPDTNKRKCEICEDNEAAPESFFCQPCQPLAEQFIAEHKREFDAKHLITFNIEARRAGRILRFSIEGYSLREIKQNVNLILNDSDLQELTEL